MDFDNTDNLIKELNNIAEHLEKCDEFNEKNYTNYYCEVEGDDKLGVHEKYLTISMLIRGIKQQIDAIDMLVSCIETDFKKLNKEE